MTQILQLATRYCVFHVSDRLLSQKVGSATLPFDRNCNKAIVFCATDAHVVVAYTGRAYIDHIPTDTFIAKSLAGSTLSDRGAFQSVSGPPAWTDIGRSVERLRYELTEAFRRLPEADRVMPFQVSIMGWRQQNKRNGRISPVVWHLDRAGGMSNEPFTIGRHHRWWRWNRDFAFCGIPIIPPDITKWMQDELLSHNRRKSPDDIKRILIAALRRCADSRPQEINYSCTQIVLTPLLSTHARIKFIHDIRLSDQDQPLSAGFTPWVVAPPVACPPALMRSGPNGGGWKNTVGFAWEYEGPTTCQESCMSSSETTRFVPVISHSSQPRKRDPQRR